MAWNREKKGYGLRRDVELCIMLLDIENSKGFPIGRVESSNYMEYQPVRLLIENRFP
jgi:hypothetical protein